jgi:hypothetical protein
MFNCSLFFIHLCYNCIIVLCCIGLDVPEDGRNIQGVGINNVDGKAGGIYAEGFLLFCCVILAMQYKVCFYHLSQIGN